MVSLRLLPLLLAVWVPWAPGALAETPPVPAEGRLALSMSLGLGSALVPMAVSGTLLATGGSREVRQGALYLLQAGLVLAPVLSHVAVGEERRALYFGLPPLACALGLLALVAAQPDAFDDGTTETRTSFAILLSLSVLSSAVGLIDTLGAPARAHAARGRWRRWR